MNLKKGMDSAARVASLRHSGVIHLTVTSPEIREFDRSESSWLSVIRLGLAIPLRARDQVSHPYETKANNKGSVRII
jgi:hypothetical protein